jgi:hypothetical protein
VEKSFAFRKTGSPFLDFLSSQRAATCYVAGMKWIWIALGSGLVCGFLFALVLTAPRPAAAPAPAASSKEKPFGPASGSQATPSLDLSKRYNIVVRNSKTSETVVYPEALFLGPVLVYKSDGDRKLASSEELFEDWVALELRDGRQVYCPEDSIERLESLERIGTKAKEGKEAGPVRY